MQVKPLGEIIRKERINAEKIQVNEKTEAEIMRQKRIENERIEKARIEAHKKINWKN